MLSRRLEKNIVTERCFQLGAMSQNVSKKTKSVTVVRKNRLVMCERGDF